MSSKQVLISTETRATALRERATVLPFPLIIRDGVLCFYVKSLIIMGSFEGLINNNYVSTVAYLTAKELGFYRTMNYDILITDVKYSHLLCVIIKSSRPISLSFRFCFSQNPFSCVNEI